MITFFAYTSTGSQTRSSLWAVIHDADTEEAVGIAATHGFNRISPAQQKDVGAIGQAGIEWAKKTFKTNPITISENFNIGKVVPLIRN